MNLENNTAPCFVTPIINYRWNDSADLNAALTDVITSMEQEDPGVQKSNVGGWHSDLSFLQHNSAAVGELRARLVEFSGALLKQFSGTQESQPASALRFEGWANMLREGQYNSVHCHPNAMWSMVYYVTGNEVPEEHPFSGKLELLDPRPGANLTYNENSALYGRLLINPSPGQIVAFPAWLQHQVHPVFSTTPRLSVAVNLLP